MSSSSRHIPVSKFLVARGICWTSYFVYNLVLAEGTLHGSSVKTCCRRRYPHFGNAQGIEYWMQECENLARTFYPMMKAEREPYRLGGLSPDR
jgi:hypothetical protein